MLVGLILISAKEFLIGIHLCIGSIRARKSNDSGYKENAKNERLHTESEKFNF